MPSFPLNSLRTAPLSGAYAVCLFALAILFAPSYFMLAKNTWSGDEEMHGPIVLGVACWVFWKLRHELSAMNPNSGSRFGWPLLVTGLVLLFFGRTLKVTVLEIGAHPMILASTLLLLGGRRSLRISLFGLLFLIFMIPLPSNLVDTLTGSLKQYVSVIAESVLYLAGYPIARSGVAITIGQYQLLVADACSGLKSIFSLSAVGAIYIYLSDHQSKVRNLLLALALIPIAFLANIVRVILLILVTFHFGDAAAQGFFHEFAGMILFGLSLAMLFALDATLGLFFVRRKQA